MLEELAFRVHEESAALTPSADTGPDGTADIGEDRLLKAFRPLLNNSWDKSAVVVDYIEKRAGLLVGQGEKDGERQFAFPHRTFQEFLAACHLAAKDDLPAECVRLARAAAGHWQVVLPLAARLAKAERGASAADELIGGRSIAELRKRRQPDADDWTRALLAGMQLQEIGLGAIQKRERTSAIRGRVADWIAASLPVHPDDGGLPAAQRAHAGDVLSALGDPRFDPERFYLPADEMLGFVHIPADPDFRIGTRKADAKRVAEIIGYEESRKTRSTTLPRRRRTSTSPAIRSRSPSSGPSSRRPAFRLGDASRLTRSRLRRPVRYRRLARGSGLLRMARRDARDGPAAEGVRRPGWCATGAGRSACRASWSGRRRHGAGLESAVFPWGNTPDPNRANYARLGDRRHLGGRLLPGERLRAARPDRQRLGVDPERNMSLTPIGRTVDARISNRRTTICWSCAAARGAIVGTSCAAPTASGFGATVAAARWVFEWSCALLLFLSSVARWLWSQSLWPSGLQRGSGGSLPLRHGLDRPQPARRNRPTCPDLVRVRDRPPSPSAAVRPPRGGHNPEVRRQGKQARARGSGGLDLAYADNIGREKKCC